MSTNAYSPRLKKRSRSEEPEEVIDPHLLAAIRRDEFKTNSHGNEAER
jgi:hypothetical protein